MGNPTIIVQARVEASRLPGKTLIPILGQPLILHLLDRLSQTWLAIVCALPATVESFPLRECLERHGYHVETPTVSGDDLLGRYAAVAKKVNADPIIRITGDCVLIDHQIVTKALIRYEQALGSVSYVALAKEWPDGLDTEVFSRQALMDADEYATLASDREHVTPWMWKQPERYRSSLLACPFDLGTEKWSVDDMEDLTLVRRIYERLYPVYGRGFGWRDIYGLIMTEPKIKARLMQQPRNQGYMRQVANEQGAATTETSWEQARYGVPDHGNDPRPDLSTER